MNVIQAIIIFLFSCAPLLAQSETTWIGGYPGRVKDWGCPYNWSNGKVPNEFSNVNIQAKDWANQNFPVINKGIYKIRHLRITEGALLRIETKASLTILDEKFEELELHRIHNQGKLILPKSFSILMSSK